MLMMEETKGLVKRIRELREGLKMSQQELATKAKLSVSIVVQLERGRTSRGVPANPRFETLVKLANALGVSIERLISEE